MLPGPGDATLKTPPGRIRHGHQPVNASTGKTGALSANRALPTATSLLADRQRDLAWQAYKHCLHGDRPAVFNQRVSCSMPGHPIDFQPSPGIRPWTCRTGAGGNGRAAGPASGGRRGTTPAVVRLRVLRGARGPADHYIRHRRGPQHGPVQKTVTTPYKNPHTNRTGACARYRRNLARQPKGREQPETQGRLHAAEAASAAGTRAAVTHTASRRMANRTQTTVLEDLDTKGLTQDQGHC